MKNVFLGMVAVAVFVALGMGVVSAYSQSSISHGYEDSSYISYRAVPHHSVFYTPFNVYRSYSDAYFSTSVHKYSVNYHTVNVMYQRPTKGVSVMKHRPVVIDFPPVKFHHSGYRMY